MAKEKFETKMQRLSEIVAKLDDSNIDLDDSIQLYEEGIKLAKDLKSQLALFETKIENINKEIEHD